MSRVLVEFEWDCGRMGSISGLFISTKKELKSLIGKTADFGECLGKHSEVVGELAEAAFTIKSEDEDLIDKLEATFDSVAISGYYPPDYINYHKEEEDE